MHQAAFEGSTRRSPAGREGAGAPVRVTAAAARLVPALGLLLSSACSFNPLDGGQVDTRSSPVRFSGYGPMPGKPVTFQAVSTSGSIINIGSATTATDPVHYADADYYPWTKDLIVPSSYWRPNAAGGYVTALRTRLDGGNTPLIAYTFPPDWADCYERLEDKSFFVADCRSHNSPLTYVYTADFPRGGDLDITHLSMPAGGGEITVHVKNVGRDPIMVTALKCHQPGKVSSTKSLELVLRSQEEGTVVSHAFWAHAMAECDVEGVNEDPNHTAESFMPNNYIAQVPQGI
jgi:hypothetical protein